MPHGVVPPAHPTNTLTSFLGDIFTGDEEESAEAAPVVATVASQPAQPAAPVKPAVPVPGVSETPAPSSPVAAPAPPKHPAGLLALAESLGTHPLVIERLDTDALANYVRDEVARLRKDSAGGGPLPSATPGVTPHQEPPPSPPALPAFDWGEHDDYEVDWDGKKVPKGKRKFTDDDVHPAVGAKIKAYEERISKLEKFIETMGKQVQTANESKKEQAFNAAFDQYADFLGSGSVASIRASAPEKFERRRLLYEAVNNMMAAMPEAARRHMTLESAVAGMAKSLFNIEPQVAKPVATVAKPPAVPADWQNGTLATPTHRTAGDKPNGVAKARQAVTDWMDDRRTNGELGDDTTLDEFFGN